MTPPPDSGDVRGTVRANPAGGPATPYSDEGAGTVRPLQRVAERADAPRMALTRRGSMSDAMAAGSSEHSRLEALLRLTEDMHAQSSRAPRCYLITTWTRLHNRWFNEGTALLQELVPTIPLIPVKVQAVVSMLKAGGCRSTPNYVSRIKEEHIIAGHAWDEQLNLYAKKSNASALRGIGPARQSAPLPLREVAKLEVEWLPAAPHGPLGIQPLIIAGSFFCLGEVEASLAMWDNISFDGARAEVTLLLPCSKTDPTALGAGLALPLSCAPRPQGPLDEALRRRGAARHAGLPHVRGRHG